MTPPIKAWSYSVLNDFEECPYRVYLSKVEKLPEPEAPALERGNRLHQSCEDFIKGKADSVDNEIDFEYWGDTLKERREIYQTTGAIVEDRWAFTLDWSITDWWADDCWLRMKLDFGLLNGDTALAADWKSGKPSPAKHNAQGALYAIGARIHFPEAQRYRAVFDYLDHNRSQSYTYNDAVLDKIQKRYTQRALSLTTATEFPPNPSKWNCRFCPHAKTQNCKFRHQEDQ